MFKLAALSHAVPVGSCAPTTLSFYFKFIFNHIPPGAHSPAQPCCLSLHAAWACLSVSLCVGVSVLCWLLRGTGSICLNRFR